MTARPLPIAALAILALAFQGAGAQPPAPAAFTPPAVGTRYVYSSMAYTVTTRQGWRTHFTDAQGRPGAHLGMFIPDNPKSPLTYDAGALARLWPLRIGSATQVETRRDPLVWRWSLTVVDTATVTVPAGRFLTYVVQAVETPRITRSPTPRVNVTLFWYAPKIDAVVRFRSGQFVGQRAVYGRYQELLRVERAPVAAGD